MKRQIIWIVALLALIFGAWHFWPRQKAQSKPGRPDQAMVPVETAFIENLNMEEIGSFTGTLLAKNSYIVAPKVSGQLSRLYVNIGDTVQKGQLLAELDNRIFLQELQKANAAVEMSRATKEQSANALQLAMNDLENQRTLLERNFISQKEFDDANARFISERSKDNIATASMNSALAAQEAAELQLSFTRITADWVANAGYRVIGERFADEGAQLSAGSPIFSLMDISSVIAQIDVIEKDYQRFKPGQTARISLDSFPGEIFTGKVQRIAPMLSESTRQARVEIEIPNPGQKLKPGMFSRVQISYQSKEMVQAVPLSALTSEDGVSGVYVVDPQERTVLFTPVQTGIQNADFVEIISPILDAEVVTLGHDLLEDGRKVSTESKTGADAK